MDDSSVRLFSSPRSTKEYCVCWIVCKICMSEACLVLHNEGLLDNCIVPVWDWAYFYPSAPFFTGMAKFGSVTASCS